MSDHKSTGPGDVAAYNSALHQAELSAKDLSNGRFVTPEAMIHARETFLGVLWGNTPGAEGRAREGLLNLYNHARSPVDKVEIIGELMNSGKRALPIFEDIIRKHDPDTRLTQDELQSLKESLSAPLPERLGLIIKWIADEMKERRGTDLPQSRSGPLGDAPWRPDPAEAILENRRNSGDRLPGQNIPGASPPSDILRDTTVPEEERLNAALKQGLSAIPPLFDMIRGGDTEFAVTALNHLLSDDMGLARAIHDGALKLETQMPFRQIGEQIRQNIEEAFTTRIETRGGIRDGTLERGRPNQATVPDGWLRRAFANCDAPSILKASAGREAQAIPLALKTLLSLRAGRNRVQ